LSQLTTTETIGAIDAANPNESETFVTSHFNQNGKQNGRLLPQIEEQRVTSGNPLETIGAGLIVMTDPSNPLSVARGLRASWTKQLEDIKKLTDEGLSPMQIRGLLLQAAIYRSLDTPIQQDPFHKYFFRAPVLGEDGRPITYDDQEHEGMIQDADDDWAVAVVPGVGRFWNDDRRLRLDWSGGKKGTSAAFAVFDAVKK
jgi:hypothetical protein